MDLKDVLCLRLSRLIFCAATLLVLIFFDSPAAAAPCLSGETGGRVFEDYDEDGFRDSLEPGFGVAGLVVRAYGNAGTVLHEAAVGSDGAYSFGNIAVAEPLRLELSGLPTYARSGVLGSESLSLVQFAGTTGCGNHFAVLIPSSYCESSPNIALSCYQNGSGVGNTAAAVVSVGYENSGYPAAYGGSGENPTPNTTVEEMGSVWGGAFQRTTRRAYFAAFIKRHVGLGPEGSGGIYVINYASSTPAVVSSFSLNGISPANGGAVIDTGTVTRNNITGDIVGDFDLSSDPSRESVDLDSVYEVGKLGLGDAEISEDERLLWVVNLTQRALISIDVSGDSASLPGEINQYPLAGLSGFPFCTGGSARPFAIHFRRGTGYLGVVCDASTSQNRDDLKAVVLSFDPNDVVAGLTEVLAFELNYKRERVISGSLGTGVGVSLFADWRAWLTDYVPQITPYAAEVLLGNFHAVAQPVLSNIRFTENGDMILGFMDRGSHQLGFNNRFPISVATGRVIIEGMSGGDIIWACHNAGNYILEGQTGCRRSDKGSLFSDDGPSGVGEYIPGDSFFFTGESNATATHHETGNGGLGVVYGRGEFYALAFDPLSNTNLVRTNGVKRFSSINNTVVDEYLIVPDPLAIPGYFGKAGGLGEPVFLCQAAPIEIGNRLWLDTDRDGVQDPGELPLAGVVVRLLDSNGVELCSVTTDSLGSYAFSSNAGTSSAGRCYGITALSPNSAYVVSIAMSQSALSGLTVTAVNGDSTSGGDTRDSDCGLSSGNATIAVATGSSGDNNHTFDCGFTDIGCSPSDLSSTLAAIDGAAGSLDAYIQVALATRDAYTRIKRCRALGSALRATILDNATTVYMDAWHSAWVDLPQYDYSGCVFPGLTCSSRDVTAVKATLSAQATFLGNLGRMVLNESCMTRQLPSRYQALADFRAQVLSEFNATEAFMLNSISSYSDIVLVCQ